ncbi:hypothetical protein ISCGN_016319 [Ixodes scapularis]
MDTEDADTRFLDPAQLVSEIQRCRSPRRDGGTAFLAWLGTSLGGKGENSLIKTLNVLIGRSFCERSKYFGENASHKMTAFILASRGFHGSKVLFNLLPQKYKK